MSLFNENTPNDQITGRFDDSRGEIEVPVVREANIGARTVMETVASVCFVNPLKGRVESRTPVFQ